MFATLIQEQVEVKMGNLSMDQEIAIVELRDFSCNLILWRILVQRQEREES